MLIWTCSCSISRSVSSSEHNGSRNIAFRPAAYTLTLSNWVLICCAIDHMIWSPYTSVRNVIVLHNLAPPKKVRPTIIQSHSPTVSDHYLGSISASVGALERAGHVRFSRARGLMVTWTSGAGSSLCKGESILCTKQICAPPATAAYGPLDREGRDRIQL
jgi:hypothetical protein